MIEVSLKNILIIIQKTLDSVDDRMVGHGEEVAYIIYKLLKIDNKYSEDEILKYAIDFRSKATVVHTISVQEISVQIANIINLDEETTMKIKIASMLHDIGKISIPVEILEKQGKLTLEEYDKIKNHAIVGYRILSDLGLDDIRDIAALHHEKLDGTGYPFKLKDSEISLEVRIVAIADIISALVGKRSYKGEFSKETVISILSDMALNNKIDNDICKIVIDKYDFIMNGVRENTKETLNIYNNIMKEYEDLLSNFEERGLFNSNRYLNV